MAVAPTSTGSNQAATPAASQNMTSLAKLFNQIVQKIISSANENAHNQ